MNNEDIKEYYNDCKKDYQLLWRLDKVWGMHFGYFEKGDKSLTNAILKMNQQIIKYTNINKNSKVLDAGCGYCGTAMYLADKIGCHVSAITLVEEQVITAKKIINEKKLNTFIDVSVQDYTHTLFEDNTFDIIYALESACYADKKLFLNEAFRLLKPNGTLIILDGFNSKEKDEYTEQEKQIMKKWNEGWAVNSLETGKHFVKVSKEIGFIDSKYIDITQNAIKTSKIMYIASFPAVIVDFFGRLFKKRTQWNKKNVIAAKYQYIGMKKNLWQYGIFSANKKG